MAIAAGRYDDRRRKLLLDAERVRHCIAIDGTRSAGEVVVETVPVGISMRLRLTDVRYDTGLGDAQLAGRFGAVRGGAVGLQADEP